MRYADGSILAALNHIYERSGTVRCRRLSTEAYGIHRAYVVCDPHMLVHFGLSHKRAGSIVYRCPRAKSNSVRYIDLMSCTDAVQCDSASRHITHAFLVILFGAYDIPIEYGHVRQFISDKTVRDILSYTPVGFHIVRHHLIDLYRLRQISVVHNS